jgi:hypothetical protein
MIISDSDEAKEQARHIFKNRILINETSAENSYAIVFCSNDTTSVSQRAALDRTLKIYLRLTTEQIRYYCELVLARACALSVWTYCSVY